MQEAVGRSRRRFTIGDSTLIQAEDYSAMNGVKLEGTGDTGGGANICYADPGDWMEYPLLVTEPGIYELTVRLANDMPGSSFEIVPGNETVQVMAVHPTKGWQQWEGQTTLVRLNTGEQTLRVNFLSGACNINWLRLRRIANKP